MYKLFFSIFFISIFFISCSSPEALIYFDKSDLQKRAVQNTKKADILNKEGVEVILWASYLNPISKRFKNGNEKFLVSTYFSNKINHNFLEKGYNFLLNEKEVLSIKKLNKNDSLVKALNNNPWASYYILEFKKVEKKIYDLKLSFFKENKKLTVSFQK